MPANPGRVLLLSPIVGAFEAVERMQHFVPPRAEHLARLADRGHYTPPARCEIHVGGLDWQSVPAYGLGFAAPIGILVTVVPGAGHMLGRELVGPPLDRWLPASAAVTARDGEVQPPHVDPSPTAVLTTTSGPLQRSRRTPRA